MKLKKRIRMDQAHFTNVKQSMKPQKQKQMKTMATNLRGISMLHSVVAITQRLAAVKVQHDRKKKLILRVLFKVCG